jgi:hypothetical protein
MDALHCQKDPVKLIAEQEQHYLIALKNNQPNLVKTLDNLHQTTDSLSYAEAFDKSHGRQVRRRVWVYPTPPHLRKHWSSLQSLIYVEREGWRDDKPFFIAHRINCFCSSLRGGRSILRSKRSQPKSKVSRKDLFYERSNSRQVLFWHSVNFKNMKNQGKTFNRRS